MPEDDGLVEIGGAEEADHVAKQAGPKGPEQDFSGPVQFRLATPEADLAEANDEDADEEDETEEAGVLGNNAEVIGDVIGKPAPPQDSVLWVPISHQSESV